MWMGSRKASAETLPCSGCRPRITWLLTWGTGTRRSMGRGRVQCANYVHAHAGFKPSPIFNHPHLPFPARYCMSWHCQSGPRARSPVDSTEHVLLDCPAHARARADLMQTLDSLLSRCGLTREHDVATRGRLVRLLLGSPHQHIQARLFSHPDAYRDILRASAKFIRSVHATRWPQHT